MKKPTQPCSALNCSLQVILSFPAFPLCGFTPRQSTNDAFFSTHAVAKVVPNMRTNLASTHWTQRAPWSLADIAGWKLGCKLKPLAVFEAFGKFCKKEAMVMLRKCEPALPCKLMWARMARDCCFFFFCKLNLKRVAFCVQGQSGTVASMWNYCFWKSEKLLIDQSLMQP